MQRLVYDSKANKEQLFFRLVEDGGDVELELVTSTGECAQGLLRVDKNGTLVLYSIDSTFAEKAGLKLDSE